MATYPLLRDASTGRLLNLDQLPSQQRTELLLDARRNGRRAICATCHSLGRDLEVSIVYRRERIQFARQPGAGSHHFPNCQHHCLSKAEAGKRGWSEAVVRRAKDSTVIKVKFVVRDPLDVLQKHSDVGETGQAVINASRPQSAATLVGLQSYLLECAAWDRFKPANVPTQAQRFNAIREAARHFRIEGMPRTKWQFADRLLIQNSRDADFTKPNSAALKRAGRYRVLFVCEVNRRDEDANHAMDLLGKFGVDVEVPAHVLQKARGKYLGGSASLRDPRRRTLIFGICKVVRADDGRLRAVAEEVCLTALSDGGVPVNSSREREYFNELERRGRRYRVLLRYDADLAVGLRPDGLLEDVEGEPWPLEIFGFMSEDYIKRKNEKCAIYDAKYPGRWAWWDPVRGESLADAIARLPPPKEDGEE